MSLVGQRLKEARKALGLSQEAAATLVGITREHWGRCERGNLMPGGQVWAALAMAGTDVNFVLTGRRHAKAPTSALLTAEEPAPATQEMAQLNPTQQREKALLELFELAGDDGRRLIEGVARHVVKYPLPKEFNPEAMRARIRAADPHPVEGVTLVRRRRHGDKPARKVGEK